MRISGLAAWALAALIAVSAQARADEMRAEVIHWWTSGGESAAVKVFADAFSRAGGTWVDTAIAGGVNARTAGINRIVGGNPPTAMQFNTGKQFEDLVDNEMLVRLDRIANAENWPGIMPPPILQAVTREGHQYAAPVNIHGQNWLFWSIAALAKAGAKPPTNWNELFDALDKLKAAGIVPLAFSGQKNWERGLFNATIVGKGGASMFEAFWGRHNAKLAKSPEFLAVAETYRRLHDYVDPGSPGRNWNDATAMVIQGRAGMQFMGDWAKGEFSAAGLTPDKDYGCTVLADKGEPFIMGGDVFVFPRLESDKPTAAQAKLVEIMLQPDVQIAFAQKKGSIPVRQDVDVSTLDACARKAVAWIKDPEAQVPANEMLSPPALTGAMEDVISQFWNNSSMTPAMFVSRVAAVLEQPL